MASNRLFGCKAIYLIYLFILFTSSPDLHGSRRLSVCDRAIFAVEKEKP